MNSINKALKHDLPVTDNENDLDASIGKIIINTIIDGVARKTLQATNGEPVSTLVIGGILGLGALVTSPIWILGLTPYAIGKRISNTIKKRRQANDVIQDNNNQLQIHTLQKEFDFQIPIKEKPREPKLDFTPQIINQNKASLSHLEKLPWGIHDLIGDYLEYSSASRLMLASKSSHTFFKKSWKASALLNYVKKANCVKAEKLFEHDPLLIFKPATYLNDHGILETISPLKLAVKLCDSNMLNLFRNKINTLSHNTKLIQTFEQQLEEQVFNYVDLTDLIQAYQKFQELFLIKIVDGIVSDEDISQALLNIGQQQQRLPYHLWYVFSTIYTDWRTQYDFDVNKHLQSNIKELEQHPASMISGRVGHHSICVRGEGGMLQYYGVGVNSLKLHDGKLHQNIYMPKLTMIAQKLREDLCIFQRVFDKRMQEIESEYRKIHHDKFKM